MATIYEQITEGIGAALEDLVRDVTQADLLGMWQLMIRALEAAHGDRFRAQLDPDHQAWKQLAAVTIAKKGHAQILVEKGFLFASLANVNHFSIRDVQKVDDGWTLRFGTNRPWAFIHQEGGRRIPQRKFLGADDGQVDEMAKRVADALIQGV